MAGLNKPPQMEKIKWLKRLTLEIDDEDSSDATPQRTEPEKTDKKQQKKSPVNTHRDKEGAVAVELTNKKRTEIDGSINKQQQKHKSQEDEKEAPESRRRPRKEKKSDESKHLRPQNEKRVSKARSLSAVKTMGGDGELGGKRKGQEGKMVQRKRSHDEMIAKEKTNESQHAVDPKPQVPGDPAKATAAARRMRRMRKLQARRKATGEHDRLAAVKLKRHESLQSTRLQRNQREQVRRTGKANANIPSDAKDEIVPRPRLRPPLSEEAKERKREGERQQRAALKAKKEDARGSKGSPQSALPLSASLKSPNGVKRHEELRRLEGAEPCVVPVEKVERSQKRRKLKLEKMGASIGGFEETIVQAASNISPAKSPSSNQSKALATGKSKVGGVANLEYPQNARQAGGGEKAPNSGTNSGVESEVTKVRPCSNQDDPAAISGFQGQQELTQDLSRDKGVDTQEEGQVCSPTVVSDASGETTGPQSGNEKDLSDEKKVLLLDMMPIPRKSLKRGPVTENAASFVIPKRPANEQAEVHSVSQAPDPLNDPTPVLVKPPTSSPQLFGREPLRLHRRRTKNPVPISKLTLSVEDRALMRLSRKRNSILMAAAELASQSPTCDGLKKMTTTCVMGYEVLGTDGKALPDLIPRLSSATKREMASDKTVFAASFFGVSLSAPKAKGETASTLSECIDGEEVRKMSCYEELLFERPEDRGFYQQRMYGTSFAPQRLRGRTTLVVRRARFERKSTGIRFNQDRDREEFAASLSKRYTFNKSVPRCNIPRENWQKLTRNQPSTVYLHYYNREDAERASHVFHDDCGNPLELKLDYKAGVVISRSSSPAAGGMLTRAPRRSCSSERSAPEPSPLSSHNDSARGTPYRHRETQHTANSDYRYSRYDRPSPAQFNRGRDRYGVSTGGDKWHVPEVERRSRSRSGPRSFYSERHAQGVTGTNAPAEPAAITSDIVPANTEDRNGDTQPTTMVVATNDVNDGESIAKNQAPVTTSPQQSQSATIKNDVTPENATGSDEEGQEEGEIETCAVDQRSATVNGGRRMLRRSPPRHWQQSSDWHAPQQQDRFRGDLPIRERAGDYRPYENHNRDSDRRRSRSRSRPRPAASAPRDERGRDGRWYEPYSKERRHSREFGPIDFYDDNEQRSYSGNRDRYRGHDYRDGGDYDGRGGGAYSRQY